MTDDLVERLKDRGDWLVDAVATSTQNRLFLRGEPECDVVACDAIRMNGEMAMSQIAKPLADRIEELEAENHLLKTSSIAEVAARNPSVMEYMKHWEGRAEAAETLLAKAADALGEAIFWFSTDKEDIARNSGLRRIITTYAELMSSEAKGGKDE